MRENILLSRIPSLGCFLRKEFQLFLEMLVKKHEEVYLDSAFLGSTYED